MYRNEKRAYYGEKFSHIFDKLPTCYIDPFEEMDIILHKYKYGEKALPPIEHLDDSPYFHYALQLSMYKYILEKNYGITISKLRLGIFHPTYNKPYVLEMPYLKSEIDILLGLRSEVVF